MMKYPILLSPIAKSRIWGGDRLSALGAEPPIGEHWTLSVRDGDCNIIANGEFVGMDLGSVLLAHPEFLGTDCVNERFPLLIKFIDSKEALSIQVHPDDESAEILGEECGKTEMWYIIDAEPDSYIYFGIKDEFSEQEVKKAILSGADPTPCLNKVPVKSGECYFIAGGTPHAIGGGNYICEIQQNCDTTYRIYDYGRPRELHLEQAAVSVKKIPQVVSDDDGILADCEYFRSELVILDGECVLEASAEKFISLTVIKGKGIISASTGEYSFEERDSIFIPAGEEKYLLRGNAEMIKTTV
jgi:mannose-6-phosphate isomerase